MKMKHVIRYQNANYMFEAFGRTRIQSRFLIGDIKMKRKIDEWIKKFDKFLLLFIQNKEFKK